MHLGIDVREACRTRRAGKAQWCYGFVSELLTRAIPLTLYTDAPIPSEWKPLISAHPQCNVTTVERAGFAWHRAVAADVRARTSMQHYVSTVSYIVPALLGSHKKVIPIVHDLIAFMHEPHDRRATYIERLTLGRTVRHAHHICTVSETTKADLLKRFGNLDPANVTAIFAAPPQNTVRTVGTGNLIVCISTLCPRKNQLRLIQAYSALPQELRARYPLVLVGARGWHDDAIVASAAATPGVEWKGYMTDAQIDALLEQCAVFAYPSLYEGFGLPILEAFRRGIPVLTSDVGSMKEVAGDTAVLVHPTATAAITDGLSRMLTDAALRASLQRAGVERATNFSWKRTVDLFLNVL